MVLAVFAVNGHYVKSGVGRAQRFVWRWQT